MTDDVTDFDHNDAAMQDFDALSELDSLFEDRVENVGVRVTP